MKEKDTCDIYCCDEPKVSRIQESLRNQDMERMTKTAKGLADETRMKIVYALCEEAELCVCDVARIIGSSIATASHHLRALKSLGFAKYRKEGKLVFYSLDDERVRRLVQILSANDKELAAHGQ